MEDEKEYNGEKVTGSKAGTMINNINEDRGEVLPNKKMDLS